MTASQANARVNAALADLNAGGKVDIWTPDHEGGDLNDVFRLPADEAEAALGEAFDFAKEAR